MSFLGGILKSVAAPVVGGLFGTISGQQTNTASARAAANANAFTKEQMQNRHQWEVNDLLKAGLNPVLSAGGTPSMGGSAVADVINPADSAYRGVSSAIEVKRLGAELENIQADTTQKTSQSQANAASRDLDYARMYNEQVINKILQANATTAKANARITESQIPGAINEKKFQQDVGKYGPWGRFFFQGAKDLLGTAHSAKSLVH